MTLTETTEAGQQGDFLYEGISQAVQDAFVRAFTNFKGTVSYSLKRSRGEYSNSDAEELGIHVQFDYDPNADTDEFVASASDALMRAKSLVYMGLGREVERDANGIVQEANTNSFLNAFPGAVIEEREDIVPDSRDDSRSQVTTRTANKPPHDKAYLDSLPKGSDELKEARNENTAWAKARFEAGFENEFWDNSTDKRYPNSPDYAFKDKNYPAGFWVD